MITFAGKELLLPDPDGELQAWLDKYRPLDDIFPFLDPPGLVDGRTRPQGAWPHSVGLPTPNWSLKPPRWKLNTLWWPTGASRFGVGLFVTDHATAVQLQSATESDGSGTLALTDGAGGSLSVPMYMLPPRPLAPVVAGANPPVLLILVDRRYFFRWSQLGSLLLGPDSTWTDLRSAIAGGLSISASEPASTYLNPDWSEWLREYENVAVAADAYAASVGQRFVAGLDGSFAFRSWSADETTAAANISAAALTAGSPHLTSNATAPGTLLVAFPKRQGGIVQQRGSCYSVTKSAADYDFSGTAAGTASIHSTCQADYSSRGGSPDNSSALNALANQVASDFYGWKRKQYGLTVPGLASGWTVTGFDDFLWFHYGHQVASEGCECEGGGLGYTLHTQVESLPPSFGVEEQTSQQSLPRTFRPMPVFRAELITDFADPGDGTPWQATAKLLYDATGGTGLLTKDSVAVAIFDTLGQRGSLAAGGKVWVACLGADTSMFELISSSSSSAVRFKLTADKVTGEPAAAIIRKFDGSAYVDGTGDGAVITVHDWWSESGGAIGMWQGKAGMEGLAIKRETPTEVSEGVFNDSHYDIIWMEGDGWDVEATASANVDKTKTPWETAITVDKAFHQGLTPSITKVYDRQEFFPYVQTGAQIKAIRDEHFYRDDDEDEETPDVNENPAYQNANAQQMCFMATAITDEDSCGEGLVAIRSFSPQNFSPFNLTPDPTPVTVLNFYGFPFKADAPLGLEWHEGYKKWIIAKVAGIKRKVIFQDEDSRPLMRLNAGKLQGLVAEVMLLFCEEPEYEDLLPTKPCTTGGY